MEDILGSLNSFSVTGQPNSVHAEHPRFSQFKAKQSKSSQEERRKAVLAARKGARYDLLNHVRHIEEGVAEEDENSIKDEGMDLEEASEVYRKPKRYKDFLMLSEWLVDVPQDFAVTHLAVPCPTGKRCLVVAARGRTVMYGRNGKFVEEFQSVLPGGSKLTAHSGYAMFDCLACYEPDNMFYILDMLAWKNQAVIQCETPFRFEWIRSRLEETEYDLAVESDNNAYKFMPLKYHPCDHESLQKMLDEPKAFTTEVDGILFYHKCSHYTHGQTPLVGWLKPYMMDEILGVSVPSVYKEQKPEKYQSLPQHILYGQEARQQRLARNQHEKQEKQEQRQAKHQERIVNTRRKKDSMDTSAPETAAENSSQRMTTTEITDEAPSAEATPTDAAPTEAPPAEATHAASDSRVSDTETPAQVKTDNVVSMVETTECENAAATTMTTENFSCPSAMNGAENADAS